MDVMRKRRPHHHPSPSSTSITGTGHSGIRVPPAMFGSHARRSVHPTTPPACSHRVAEAFADVLPSLGKSYPPPAASRRRQLCQRNASPSSFSCSRRRSLLSYPCVVDNVERATTSICRHDAGPWRHRRAQVATLWRTPSSRGCCRPLRGRRRPRIFRVLPASFNPRNWP